MYVCRVISETTGPNKNTFINAMESFTIPEYYMAIFIAPNL